ncbi:MAG: penicillin acylase family protein, partial [Pseudomonadota bacterium]
MARHSHAVGPRSRNALSLAGLAGSVLRRTVGQRFPALSVADRLKMLPTEAPVEDGPLTIRWNANHVPLVEAQSMRDAAVGLGIVHSHLRLTQMEIMRRAATGRLAEVAGKAAVELDAFLRLMDFPRATEASLAMMPGETRAWVDGFAAGINTAARCPPPPEFKIFNVEFEPWTAEDLFAVSRLCSADYTWSVWRSLSRLRQRDEWRDLWRDLVGVAASMDEAAPLNAAGVEAALPTLFSPNGSNALAVSGTRTKSGKPILACDPHLMVGAPSPWLLAGFSVPDQIVWGIMIPALPIFGLGRNRFGAWGGTNLHATSSELVDVADEPLDAVTATIKVKGRRPQRRRLRQSEFGPVISDARPFAMPNETVALHWIGHQPCDGFTAYLNLMTARDCAGFKSAIDGFSQPGLNMLWADAEGCIGKMIGARLPRRPLETPDDIVTTPDRLKAQWEDLLTGEDLPKSFDPPAGYLVSANEAVDDPPTTISHFFSAKTRAHRIGELVAQQDGLTLAHMTALQCDVFDGPALALAKTLAPAASKARPGSAVAAALGRWDGMFHRDSEGALAFQLIAAGIIEGQEKAAGRATVAPGWRPFERLRLAVAGASQESLEAAME